MGIEGIEHNPLLYGHDTRTGIVAIEPAGHFVRIFRRAGAEVQFHDEPFHPFILVNSPALLSGCRIPCSLRQLEGSETYRFQLLFESWGECCAARDFLAGKTGRSSGAGDAPYLFLPDLAHQYMVSTGATLFKGVEFDELRCMALDIETYCSAGYEFSNPEREEDRIISIALKNSHGDEIVLRGDRLSEAALICALNDAVRQNDPDIIIGHNIFRFDLDYIGTRARRLGISLNWGRNGTPAHVSSNARWSLAERVIDYPRWDVYGRHVIDTYFLVLLYDIGQRSLESHGLKQVARHFGVAAENRTYLDGGEIAVSFRADPERLFSYNLDDVRETLELYRIVAYPWFLQTRIFPYQFQSCPLKGNATRINALFLREYLHRGHAIPAKAEDAAGFEGGYTELVREGVCGPIVHCDVASLYPSLMLAYQLKPAADSLGLFLPMLAELRRFRLDAKQAAKDSPSVQERHYYNALQQVFKVLINSFFGYLGASQHNFSDHAAAAEVTRLGRVTIKNMIELLKGEGAEPVEVDTDGIYFCPPPECDSEDKERALITRVSKALPEGIDVEMDGRYQSMFAYKAKNYALLEYDGRIVIRGSSLKSRGIELYLREFMRDMIGLLLNGRAAGVESLFEDYVIRLRSRKLEVGWIARTETLNESPHSYREKLRLGRRNHSAAFEIAAAAERSYRAGDQISYYVSGAGRNAVAYESCRPSSSFDTAHPDINAAYYIEKLRHLRKRFEKFLPQEPTLFDL